MPVLGCVSGEGKRIIEESGAGIVSGEISVKGLVNVCRDFLNMECEHLEDYKNRAYQYGNKFFNKNKLIMYLEKSMDKI